MLTIALLYAAIGAAAGIFAGLLGIGGGLVVVPMLVFAFNWQGMPPELIMHLALGTSMGSIVFTSISSSRAHHKRQAVDWSVVKAIALGIVVGTYGGSMVATALPSDYLKLFFVVFLLYVGTQMLTNKKPKPTRHMPGFPGMTAAGLGIGLVSSLVGIGGGTLSVPFMVWHNMPMHRSVGTSAAIGFPIAVAGSLGYIVNGLHTPNLPEYSLGFLYLPALVGIVLISVCTAPLGAALAHKLPVDKLKKSFSFILFVVAIKMVFEVI